MAWRQNKIIIETSKIIKKTQGKVPSDLALLEEIPGVDIRHIGVVSEFSKARFPVDTHIQDWPKDGDFLMENQ